MKESTKSIVAKNLQRYLDNSGISKSELAKRLNVSPATVTFWVQGKATPRADMLDEICDVLHLDREYIVSDNVDYHYNKAPSKTIPIYRSIHADEEKEFFEETNIIRYMSVDVSTKADFGMAVASDAMSGIGIYKGDIAFFSRNYTFSDGKIYGVWILERDAIALKRAFDRGDDFMLSSEKANSLPFYVGKDKAFIVGELVGVYKTIEQ